MRLYVPLFTTTLLLSAFLLFAVEPMAGKMILPLLGGAPMVWNTAMVFFQSMLLAGYAYAHVTSKYLPTKIQAALHVALLAGCIFLLPVAMPAGWPDPDTRHPLTWQLHLMTVMAGAPFFLLAASAPMLQHWFANSGHKKANNPYFLYAASNAGSLAALLAYPTIIEPMLSLSQQSHLWSFGFVGLALLTGVAALAAATAPQKSAEKAAKPEPLSYGTRARWLVLALLPSSLMLGVTTYITTDIAAVPLLWVVPLALYVLTFIIAFMGNGKVTMKVASIMQALLLMTVIGILLLNIFLSAFIIVGLHLLLFFFAALLCHSELANIRPGTGRLTEFYLIIALGGVLGGMFNTLAAPLLFTLPVEYALVLALTCFARGMHSQRFTLKYIADSLFFYFLPLAAAIVAAWLAARYAGYANYAQEASVGLGMLCLLIMIRNRLAFAMGAIILLAANPGFSWTMMRNTLKVERNFFGVARVEDSIFGHMRTLMEGSTIHGAQPLVEPFRLVPIGYYHPQGPAGSVFGILDTRDGPQKVAALGLGVGSIACYTRVGRLFDFYEIDPEVPKIAEDPTLFTYLSQCGSPYKIVLGDARLRIREAPDHSYDMIFLDAFSSDNIPIHLLTTEAFNLYRQKLKPHGYIVADISNRFMDLIPVMQAQADALGLQVAFKGSEAIDILEPDLYAFASIYAVFAEKKEDLDPFYAAQWGIYDGHQKLRAWTDDYANPLAAMWFMRPKHPSEEKKPAQK